MSVSFSQACAAARKPSPRVATMTRSGAAPHSGRTVSSLLKSKPRRKCIKLNPKTAEERALTDAYWARVRQRKNASRV
jgi:hypothetical protein